MSSPLPPDRPRVVNAAALLLVLCAVLQAGFFVVLAASGTAGGFLTQLWFTVAFCGLVGFAAAAMWVWRGLAAARILTWLVALISGPWCGTLSAGVIGGISSRATPAGSGASGSHGLISDTTVTIVTGIVMGLSVLAVAGALVLLSLPASAMYFRRRRSVRQPSGPLVDHG